MNRNRLLVLSIIFILGACTKKQAPNVSAMSEEDLAKRGQFIYNANCIACHNADPKKDGTIGPAIAGSSKELVESRVLRAEYPAGYKPKRETHTMPAMPHLKDEVPALQAFLK